MPGRRGGDSTRATSLISDNTIIPSTVASLPAEEPLRDEALSLFDA
jgi:hypothetical protein